MFSRWVTNSLTHSEAACWEMQKSMEVDLKRFQYWFSFGLHHSLRTSPILGMGRGFLDFSLIQKKI